MGKSPGKWIKTLLFGKKSTKSHLSKRRDSATKNKDWNGVKGAALAVDSPVISEQLPTRTDDNGLNPEMEKGQQSDLPSGGEVMLPECEVSGKQGSAVVNVSTDCERSREEQAAIKAQAAFRGYLARRAFRALKGIIRLQALIRGHLVRRQAVATLHCMQGIVKLQALVRGRRVRHDINFQVKRSFHQAKDTKLIGLSGANVSSWKDKVSSANAFVCKVLSSSTVAKPLALQYDIEEPNSAWSWLERWTSSIFWKPPSQPKKILDSKPQGRHYAMETESGRSKRSVRKNFGANIESGSSNVASESDRPKRNLRKVSSHPIEPVQENPQSELERVKRNLRKVSNSMAETSDRAEVDTEKPKRSLPKVSNPCENLDQTVEHPTEKVQTAVADITLDTKDVESSTKDNLQKVTNSSDADQGAKEMAEKVKKDVVLATTLSQHVETTSTPVLTDEAVDSAIENYPAVESIPAQRMEIVERFTPVSGELSSKDEEASHENQKSSKRRASFSAKSEYTDNGTQNTPKLPSYMATTESAKAKLRGQNSPRFGADETDKNGFTRRHSLPSSINGKLNSLSPRTQRLVQTSGKGNLRSDRSLLSSRDGNDKPIQVEWRR